MKILVDIEPAKPRTPAQVCSFIEQAIRTTAAWDDAVSTVTVRPVTGHISDDLLKQLIQACLRLTSFDFRGDLTQEREWKKVVQKTLTLVRLAARHKVQSA